MDLIDKIRHRMADIIDLSLVVESRRFLEKQLAERGIAWFLQANPKRPYQLDPKRVDLVVRTAAKARPRPHPPHASAFEQARREVRRALIRQVVAEMLQVGL